MMSFFRFRSEILVLGCLLAALGYFGWHGLLSPKGVSGLATLQATLEKKQLELASLQSKRQAFEARVSLLRQESLDPDMLDETARTQLGLVAPNDFIVSLKRKNN